MPPLKPTMPILTVPPLENGDQLTRAEFERCYAAMPQVKKAELIEGAVYMASPVRITQHGDPHARIMAWLGAYWAATPGVQMGDNSTVRLDADNEPQIVLGLAGLRRQPTTHQFRHDRLLGY